MSKICQIIKIIRDAYFKEKTLQNKLNFADIVTETDQRVEKTLTIALKEKYPTHGWIHGLFMKLMNLI